MLNLLLPPSREKELPRDWGVTVVLSFISVFLFALIGAALWFSGGSVFLSLLPSLVLAAVVVLYARLDLAVFLMILLSMLVDMFHIPNFEGGITSPKYMPYFENLKNIQGLSSLTFLKFTIFELHYAFILVVWTLRGLARGDFRAAPVSGAKAFFLFFGMIATYFAWGTVRGGGDFVNALWEIRALFYMVLVYLLFPQVLNTRRHIHIAMWMICIGIAFKVYQGLYRYFVILRMNMSLGGKTVETVTNHEDAPFIVMVMLYFALLMIFRTGTRAQRWFLGLNTLPMFVCFVVTQRRAAYGALALGILYLPLVLPPEKRRQFIKPLIAMILAFCVYYPIFRNSSSQVGMFAAQMKTILESEEEEKDLSALWRKIEKTNLRATLQAYPLGIGFGQKYLVVWAQPKIDFDLWNYVPHNAIWWIWIKTGWVGFMIFWYLIATTLARTIMFSKRTQNPYFRAIALTAALSLCVQMVISYYDLQLTYYRNMILIGTFLALVEVARNIEARSSASTLMIEGQSA